MKRTGNAILMIFILGLSTIFIGCGGGGSSETIDYSGVTDPAVFDTTQAVVLAQELTLDTINGDDIGGLGMVVIGALTGGGGATVTSLDASAEPLAYSCESQSIAGSISGRVYGRACGDFSTGDLDYISATFTNFSNVAGQVINGGLVVNVEATSVHITFNDLMLEDTGQSLDLFMDGSMSAYESGSTRLISFDLFVDNFLEGESRWFNELDLQAEDLGSYLSFTVNGRVYDPAEGYLDIETITPLVINDGEDYPVAGELRFTGADGSSFRLVAEPGGFMVYVDQDGTGGEEWWTQTTQPWTY